MVPEIKVYLQNNPDVNEATINDRLRPLLKKFYEIMEANKNSLLTGNKLKHFDFSSEIDLIYSVLKVELDYDEVYSFILRYGRSILN